MTNMIVSKIPGLNLETQAEILENILLELDPSRNIISTSTVDKRISELRDQAFAQVLQQPLHTWRQIIPKNITGVLSIFKNQAGFPLLFAPLKDGVSSPGEIINLYKHFTSELIQEVDQEGKNALMHTLLSNQTEVASYLITAGICSVVAVDHFNRTPLYYAILNKQLESLEFILNKVDVSQEMKTTKGQLNQFLGLDIQMQEPNNSSEEVLVSPLALAVASGDIHVFERVLSQGEKINKPFDMKSLKIEGIGNVLHIAIWTNQLQLLKLLLTKMHRHTHSLRDAECYGKTPLQFAAYLGDKEAVRLLCQQGVDVNYGQETPGGTALHHLAKGWYLDADIQFRDTIQELLIWGANSKATDLLQIPQACFKANTSCHNILVNYTSASRIEQTKAPNFFTSPPVNLSFQGGGSKGMAYIGAIGYLSDKNLLNKVRRVAGTSAGAIMATLMAVGYNIDKSQDSLDKKIDKDFIDLIKLSKQSTHYKLITDLSFKAVLWEIFKNGLKHIIYPPTLGVTAKIRNYIESLLQLPAISDGEEFRNWIDDLIYEKTKIKHLTFGELSKLINEKPETYKHLYVVTAQYKNKKFERKIFKTFDISLNTKEKDAWEEECKDIIISDAVRASVSIPYIFSPHTLHVKVRQLRVKLDDPAYSNFIDGGVVNNNPIEIFDENRFQSERSKHGEQTNRETLGLSLKETVSKFRQVLEPLYEKSFFEKIQDKTLLSGIISTYLNLGEILIDQKAWNKDRMITIPVEDITATTMKPTSNQKNDMIKAGVQATEDFLNTHK